MVKEYEIKFEELPQQLQEEFNKHKDYKLLTCRKNESSNNLITYKVFTRYANVLNILSLRFINGIEISLSSSSLTLGDLETLNNLL